MERIIPKAKGWRFDMERITVAEAAKLLEISEETVR